MAGLKSRFRDGDALKRLPGKTLLFGIRQGDIAGSPSASECQRYLSLYTTFFIDVLFQGNRLQTPVCLEQCPTQRPGMKPNRPQIHDANERVKE